MAGPGQPGPFDYLFDPELRARMAGAAVGSAALPEEAVRLQLGPPVREAGAPGPVPRGAGGLPVPVARDLGPAPDFGSTSGTVPAGGETLVTARPPAPPLPPGQVSLAQKKREESEQKWKDYGLKAAVPMLQFGAQQAQQYEQQQAQAAQEQAMEDFLSKFSNRTGGGSSSTATSTQSAAISPAAAQEQRASIRQLGIENADVLGNAREAFMMRNRLSAELKRQYTGQIGKAEAGERGARRRLATETRAFNKARETVDMWRGPDPGRYWREMSNTKKAMNLIAVALGGFVEGFSGGKIKNRAAEILERAIDRDLQAQRDKHAANLQSLGLAQDERDRAQVMFDRYGERLRGLMKSMTAVKLGEVAAKEQFGQAKRSWLGVAQGLMRESRAVEEAATPKTVTTKRKTYTSGSGMSPREKARLMMFQAQMKARDPVMQLKLAGEKRRQMVANRPPPQMQSNLDDMKKMLNQINSAMAAIGPKGEGYGRLARYASKGGIPTEAARTRDVYIQPLIVGARNAMEQGIMTDRDFDRYAISLERPLLTGKEIYTRLKLMKGRLKKVVKDKLDVAGKYYSVEPYRKQFGLGK